MPPPHDLLLVTPTIGANEAVVLGAIPDVGYGKAARRVRGDVR
jgi:hypothetical protein